MKAELSNALALLVLFGVVAGLGVFCMTAAWGDEKPKVNTSLVGDPVKGEKVYKVSCQSCHGKGGDPSSGGLKTSANFAKPELNPPRIRELLRGLSRADQMRIIKYGGAKSGVKGAGTTMAPIGNTLSDQQLADVVAYINTFAAFKQGK